jgi:hypothetical protein
MRNCIATIVKGSLLDRVRASRLPWMFLALVSLALAATTPVAADPVPVPIDLNPGDQYRLAYVTSTTGPTLSADITFYNDLVTNLANTIPALQSLGTNWNVIGSTRSPSGQTSPPAGGPTTTWINARTNTGTTPTVGNADGPSPGPVTGGSVGVPIYRLDGIRIADDNNDLWDGSIDAFLNTNENGDFIGNNQRVWTGSVNNGTGYTGDNQDRNLGSTNGAAQTGITSRSDGGWLGDSGSGVNTSFHFYGMSEILTVPEPGSFMLASIGAIVLLGIRFGRKRTKANAS